MSKDENPSPEQHLRGDADFRTLVGMLLGTIQRQRRWLKSSLASDEIIEFDNAVDAVRAAWAETPPPQTNVQPVAFIQEHKRQPGRVWLANQDDPETDAWSAAFPVYRHPAPAPRAVGSS
jgi:hypothetical protein